MLLTCILFRPVTEVQVKNPSKKCCGVWVTRVRISRFHESRNLTPQQADWQKSNKSDRTWVTFLKEADGPRWEEPGASGGNVLETEKFLGKKADTVADPFPLICVLYITKKLNRRWGVLSPYRCTLDSCWRSFRLRTAFRLLQVKWPLICHIFSPQQTLTRPANFRRPLVSDCWTICSRQTLPTTCCF